MKPSRRSWLFIFSALVLPLISAIIASSWFLPTVSSEVESISYGIVPWLIVDQHTTSSTIVPWGLLVCGVFTIVPAIAVLFCVRHLVTLGDVRDRCHHCGYRLLAETTRCPECGQDRFQSRTVLAAFYRPLWVTAVLLFTLPGLLMWVMFGLVWQLVTTMSPPLGINHFSTLGVLMMVSALVGALWIYRFKRALAVSE